MSHEKTTIFLNSFFFSFFLNIKGNLIERNNFNSRFLKCTFIIVLKLDTKKCEGRDRDSKMLSHYFSITRPVSRQLPRADDGAMIV